MTLTELGEGTTHPSANLSSSGLIARITLIGSGVMWTLYYGVFAYFPSMRPRLEHSWLFNYRDTPGMDSAYLSSAYRFGVHYFGDFLLPWAQAEASSPYLVSNLWISAYPPSFYALLRPITWLPYPPVLIIALVTFLVIPPTLALASTRGKVVSTSDRILLAAATALCYPTLFSLDRGNLQAWVVLAVGIGWIAYQRESWLTVGISFGIAAAMKPYVAILFLLLLVPKSRWVGLLAGSILFLVLNVIGMTMMTGSVGDNLREYSEGQKYFATTDPVPMDPSNARLVNSNRTLVVPLAIMQRVGTTSPKSLAADLEPLVGRLIHWYPRLMGLISAVVVTAGFLRWTRRQIDDWQFFVVLLIIPLLAPSVIYGYASLILIPAVVSIDSRTTLASGRFMAILLAIVLVPKNLVIGSAAGIDVGLAQLLDPLLLLTILTLAILSKSPPQALDSPTS